PDIYTLSLHDALPISILAEPLEECLLKDAAGNPCLEAVTPVDLEAELAMPGGHIFHRDLSWPFAESDEEVGRWGVETEHPNLWRSEERRGGRAGRQRR